MEGYRHLCVHLDNRLDWKCNTEAVYRKGHSRLNFLKKLKSFTASEPVTLRKWTSC